MEKIVDCFGHNMSCPYKISENRHIADLDTILNIIDRILS